MLITLLLIFGESNPLPEVMLDAACAPTIHYDASKEVDLSALYRAAVDPTFDGILLPSATTTRPCNEIDLISVAHQPDGSRSVAIWVVETLS